MTDVRRGFAALLALGSLSLGLLVVSNVRQLQPVEDVVGAAALPVQTIISSSASAVGDAFANVFSGSDLQDENERLRDDLERLTAENARLRQLQFENDQLRKQLGFTTANPHLPTLDARVVGRDPSSLRQYVVLDRGSDNGVAPGMAVVDPSGALIGQVLKVEASRSEVLLITDLDSSVNAKVERTRADGIVEGRWQQGGFLEMRYIEQGLTADGEPRVQKGDWIVTSGLGGNVPDDLLIGQVTEVIHSATGLEQRAQVTPAVDVRSVENALIVMAP